MGRGSAEIRRGRGSESTTTSYSPTADWSIVAIVAAVTISQIQE
jgi:hypothetical protein